MTREVVKWKVGDDSARTGRNRGFLLVGLRGVGKTVLLARLAQSAEAEGFIVVSIETPEKRFLPALLIPPLRTALLQLDRIATASEFGKKALRVLGGFVKAMKGWQCADQSPITEQACQKATQLAISELDASFFRVRFDRLTPSEKRYLRAMAELGPGPHRSGDIAPMLKKEVNSVAPTRATLISKGMIYSPSHGDTHFTVPLFDGYMKRVMPSME